MRWGAVTSAVYGRRAAARRVVGSHRTSLSGSTTTTGRWKAARAGSRMSYWHPLRAPKRDPVADVAAGTGLWVWHDVLASIARLARAGLWDLMHFVLLNWLA